MFNEAICAKLLTARLPKLITNTHRWYFWQGPPRRRTATGVHEARLPFPFATSKCAPEVTTPRRCTLPPRTDPHSRFTESGPMAKPRKGIARPITFRGTFRGHTPQAWQALRSVAAGPSRLGCQAEEDVLAAGQRNAAAISGHRFSARLQLRTAGAARTGSAGTGSPSEQSVSRRTRSERRSPRKYY